MQISWTTDEEFSEILYSEKCDPNEEGEFCFKFENWERLGRPAGIMHFSIHFYPGMLWKTISMLLPGLESPRGGSELLHGENDEISCTYFMKSNFTPRNGKHHVIKLESVVVKTDIDKFLKLAAERFSLENHKIVGQIKIYTRGNNHLKRLSKSSGLPSPIFKKKSGTYQTAIQSSELLCNDGRMKVRTIHLGRAQRIITDHEFRRRVYQWKAGEERPFEGTSNSSLEDLTDADHIAKSPNISPRPQEPYVPDNDCFSNPRKVLPVDVNDIQKISLQFHNMKFSPPQFTELHVKPEELLSYSEFCWGKISVEIKTQEQKIQHISFTCEDYQNTLNDLGKYSEPKTI